MIFIIDPHSAAYDNNQLFNLADPFLNRDDGLVPFVKLKESLESEGFEVLTLDLALDRPSSSIEGAFYISFGRIRSIEFLRALKLRLYAFLILEPPLVDPRPYDNLKNLTQNFENVFIHNIHGDCYSLAGVDQSKLKKFFWPQPHTAVLKKYWDQGSRKKEVLMINGHHKPKGFSTKERYSERIKWITSLNKFVPCKIYGRGWNRILTSNNLWPIYLRNFFKLRAIYHGECKSKFELMAKYEFSLCFENLSMDGYITEKIFDCFYSGIIPIYWGGNDIEKWIPNNSYIDIRKYPSPEMLANYLLNLSSKDILEFKENGRKFIEGEESVYYYNMFLSLGLTSKPWLAK